ncbi:hypothetical protein LTR66_007773 [Elasticomyces elasticus]|nr:hypothetical protein LTR66_007773 [Elasticomyces elasticus]
MATVASAGMVGAEQFMATSGATDPVWVHTEPYSKRPQFSKLSQDLETDVCIVGSGVAGISTAYELVTRGLNVVMIEARDILSGETGRTSGHLSSMLSEGFTDIAEKHGDKGAIMAAESHQYAIDRVGEISKKLGIDCEYRKMNAYEISKYPRSDPKHKDDVEELKEEVAKMKAIGMTADFKEGFAIPGWDGKIDQRDAMIIGNQATFHPTKYFLGVLKWLKDQPNFSCYTHTRMMDLQEKGIEIMGMGSKDVKITTEAGNTITCKNAVEATCIPLQKLSVVAEMEFMRTYCIAIRVPKNYIEDCLIYDTEDAYKYVRFTACDSKDDYLVIGGCDHKVGQEGGAEDRFAELEDWVRERFTRAGSVDYKWSGQVFESKDFVAFIGTNQGMKHTYVATGDCGNGLTHYVMAGKLIADEIQGVDNPWAKLYNPSRLASIVKSLPSMVSHDLQINAQYKRFLQSDIKDIEDLAPGTGGVLNPTLKMPIAVYKDEQGNVTKRSALCPHLKGVVCWNNLEKSWDCPVHGSRFSKEGICLIGPSKGNLSAAG